ncbi:MAG: asparagine synthase-related protein [Proteobacteria bacterium]|nr:asparagine synthase-related protein [Pseudomonadota bacterium]
MYNDNDSITKIASSLRDALMNTVAKNMTPNILFSGGLDTSILAGIVCAMTDPSKVFAISVSLSSEGEDIHYSRELAEHLHFHHKHISISVNEAIGTIPFVIKTLRSFDPAIPNDLAAYFGLKTFHEKGAAHVMAGDGADELFGGYDFMRDFENLSDYIKMITPHMNFSSNTLAASLGMKVNQPFLDDAIIDLALNIPDGLKIAQENGETHGKWILRKAFSGLIPDKFLWQTKRPLEVGSGMSILRSIITARISDEYFSKKCGEYPVRLRNKEHLYYYEIFRREVGDVPCPREGERVCTGCGAGVKTGKSHCAICGWMEEELS